MEKDSKVHVEDTFAKKDVISLIQTYGNVVNVTEDFHGFDVYELENGLIIRLPNDFSRIKYTYLEQIANYKLNVPSMEFDYWLGELGK